MKYKYLYQDKTNRNCEGWIKARNREQAYTLVRKMGIKPYRIIGDDPLNWRPWAIGAAFALLLSLAVALGLAAARERDETSPAVRQQLEAEIDFEALPTALDRYLAWFAQPGRWVERPPADEAEMAGFAADLETELAIGGEQALLLRILAGMRLDMKLQLEGGMDVAEYCEYLESRQRREQTIRLKAADSVRKAQPNYRESVFGGVNARLREMGIEPLSEDDILKKE